MLKASSEKTFDALERGNKGLVELRIAVVKDLGGYETPGWSHRRTPIEGWIQAVVAGTELRKKAEAQRLAPERIAALLKALGSDRFDERENATEQLLKLGKDVRKDVAACEKETGDPEIRARCADILNSIDAPSKTGLAVIQLIESCNATILRSGARHPAMTPRDFATHLRGKAILKGFSLARPAAEFIKEIASESSLHGTPYKIQFHDGTERDLKDWLIARLKLDVSDNK